MIKTHFNCKISLYYNPYIFKFPDDLIIIRCLKEKRSLERDMKVASMKLVTLYQELLIMAEMEDKDQQLIKKLGDLMKEKQAMED